MSYTPTTWAAGDTITSAKLNKLEQGLGNAITFVHISEVEVPDNDDSENEGLTKVAIEGSSPPGNLSDPVYKLDKTYAEIAEAFENGLVLCITNVSYDEYEIKTLEPVQRIGTQNIDENITIYCVMITGLLAPREPYTFYSDSIDGELTTVLPDTSNQELVDPDDPDLPSEQK